VILEDQVLILVVAVKSRHSLVIQIAGLTSVPGRSGDMSLCRIQFFLRDPDVGVFTETLPIHLVVQLKEFSGIGTETTSMWWHWSPWDPSDCSVKLESSDEHLVHDRECNETDVEHFVE
jgi:hypothetical protein